jgi:hypothetical protein
MSEPPTISNTQIEREERLLDPEVLSEVCRLKLVTRDKLVSALRRRNRRTDLKVAYELLLDQKRARLRKEELNMLR